VIQWMGVLLDSRELLVPAGNTNKADEQISSCQLRGSESEYFDSSILDSR